MKKPKIIFKLDRSNRGKVYVGKWLRDVTMVDIHGEPYDYSVTIEQYKRDSSGRLIVNGEIERKTTTYRYKR